jgi:Ca2+/Na+ antiporter
MITSQTQIIKITGSDGQVIKSQKMKVWNPTVANLTLMALGSSAPEILLSVLETVLSLGECPGELGASTIVGSASFNLLVISAVSIYAVNEKTDNDPDRDTTVPKGVKKIYDMGVFGITAFSSVFAYIWMYIVLQDQQVSVAEAWLTLFFFFLLIICAFGADKYKTIQVEKERLLKGESDEGMVIEFEAVEIYKELLKEQNGQRAEDAADAEKREKMKGFIRDKFKTDQIENVDLNDLKKAVDGDTMMMSKAKYRK